MRGEHPGNLDEYVGVGGFGHGILGARKPKARNFAQLFGGQKNVTFRRGHARADRRAPEIYHPQPLFALGGAPAVAADRLGKTRELASQRHGTASISVRPMVRREENSFSFF